MAAPADRPPHFAADPRPVSQFPIFHLIELSCA